MRDGVGSVGRVVGMVFIYDRREREGVEEERVRLCDEELFRI